MEHFYTKGGTCGGKMTDGREEGGRRKGRGSRTYTLSTKEKIPNAALI